MKRNSLLVLITLLITIPCYAAPTDDLVDNGLPYFLTASVFPEDKGEFDLLFQPQYNNGKGDTDLFFAFSGTYGITDSWQIYYAFTPWFRHSGESIREKRRRDRATAANTQTTTQTVPDDRPDDRRRRERDDRDRRTKQVQVVTQVEVLRPEGISNGDTDIGTQYSWMNIQKSNYSASLLFNIHVPTGEISKNTTDGLLRYEPFLIVAKDFPHKNNRIQIFSQIGFSLVKRMKSHDHPILDEPAAHSFIWNNGIADRFEKVNFSLELNWETTRWNHHGDLNEVYITPGIYIQATKNVSIGFGLPIGLSRDADNFEAIGNVIISFDCSSSSDDSSSDDSTTSSTKTKKNSKKKVKAHSRKYHH